MRLSLSPRITRITRITGTAITKTFGSTVALRAVDTTLASGQLTLIQGPNGSGKTTLLAILGGILSPTSGTLHYHPVGPDPAQARSFLGWLSHDSLAYPDLTCHQNLTLIAQLHGLDPATAWRSASERFQLATFANTPLRSCSRGQRQRFALARTLLHSPSVLLLDEPTTGLDVDGIQCLLDVLHDELAAGTAVAVVSHDPQLFAPFPGPRTHLVRGRPRP